MKEHLLFCVINRKRMIFFILCEGGGGGQKTKWKTPSSNFEELIESITNMLLFFAGGSRKKVMRCQSLGGGVYALNEFFEKIHNIYKFFFFAISGQHHTVRSVHRFLCVRRYGLSQLSAQ